MKLDEDLKPVRMKENNYIMTHETKDIVPWPALRIQ